MDIGISHEDSIAMINVCLRRSSYSTLILSALVVTGCGRSADTDQGKEAPRVTVAHPTARSLTDEDDYNGWLEAWRKRRFEKRMQPLRGSLSRKNPASAFPRRFLIDGGRSMTPDSS